MDKDEYFTLDFSKKPRIALRALWLAGLIVGQLLLWLIVPRQILAWLMIPLIVFLGWLASYGWRPALRSFRFWLDLIIGEGL